MIRPLLSCLFLSLLIAQCSIAADWPQFRGPAGNGHANSKNLPTTWNESTNVAWKAEIPGKGWSSPSLFQNRLYLTTAVPNQADERDGARSLHALCVDAA